MIYLVSYDLNAPEKNYERIISAIKTYGDYCPVLKSQWLISSDTSADNIFLHLRNHIDPDDALFICELPPNYAGQLKEETIHWLEKKQMPMQKI